MATMRRVPRRFDGNSLVLLAAGLLCGVALMAGVSLIHPLKQQAATPIFINSSTGFSDGVVGGRLGGITSADAAVDAATRQNVAPGPATIATDRGAGYVAQSGTTTSANTIADDNLHEGLLPSAQVSNQEAAAPLGGRAGGLQSADMPNDAATKNEVSTATQNVQPSDAAGQRDVNAAEQSGQNDFYPIFVPGHAW